MVISRNWMKSGKNSWSHARVRNDIVLLRIRQLRWPFSLTVCSNPTLCLTDLYSHPAWTKGYLLQDVSHGSHFPTELSVYFTRTLGTFHIIVSDCWLLFTVKLWAPPWFYICMALAYQCMPVGYGWDNGGRERVWEHPKEKGLISVLSPWIPHPFHHGLLSTVSHGKRTQAGHGLQLPTFTVQGKDNACT